ncbi:unc-112-related protein-like isoform X1 [Achroia grisella]|uniref:unc-112-related protein-like isoform X1 n=2 Tax=Achroia grisella TaxID=688607 RepID=UPI0027D26515|nr:unc-112-related protein-like isoform X1 [Achroia grisella]
MLADGEIVGDGSWNLTVYVTDLNEKRTMVVKGDMHIGGVMLKLTESFEFKKDWSDHALWWPTRNKWLSRPKHTLDQYSVHADATLHFTPMHKPIRIQLPDLRYIDFKIDFSIDTFSAVVQLCKSIGIRHPEELSLCYPLEQSHLKQNYQNLKQAKSIKSNQPDTNTFNPIVRGSSNSLDRSNGPCPATPPPPRSSSATPIAQQNGTLRRYGGHIYSTQSDGSSDGGYCGTPPRAASLDALDSLADSPIETTSLSRDSLLTPKSLVERARMNVGWLDSSLSIMEQYVREWDVLQLRFKFYSFYDLTARQQDASRLNQLYQQARWQILNQEVHCTEEEMLLFAALQLQIELQTLAGGSIDAADGAQSTPGAAPEDEIDAALSELQAHLEGGPPARPDITQVPELSGYLKYLRPRRFSLKAYKRGWLSCRDGVLRIHSSRDAAAKGEAPSYEVELRGAEVTPDAHPGSGRYSIKLEVPSEDAMHEMWLKCENEEQYAEWVAACRLGSRGRSLADAAFASEAAAVRALLALQVPRPAAATAAHHLPHLHHVQPDNYLAPRFLKKLKAKFTQRVLESHANVKDLPLLEAKLQYIKTWQNLPDYGQTLFVVRFMGHRKDEIISVTNNRIMRLDPNTGDHIKTWRFSTMKAWNVNWEIKHMMVQFEEGNIIFSVQSADCKVVHEFIGGYIFLSMRSKDANQTLNEELFHKLTGGWT